MFHHSLRIRFSDYGEEREDVSGGMHRASVLGAGEVRVGRQGSNFWVYWISGVYAVEE